MLSQTVEYALRAAVCLAMQKEAAATSAVAHKTKVPPAYLAKVLQALRRARLVRTQRGVGGGVALAKPAGKITILEIVNAVDPLPRIKTCPLGLKSHGVRLCPLHRRLDRALQSMEEAFAGTTLAELVAEPTESPPLCEIQ